MQRTDDGRGFLLYRCRNCGEEFYSEVITNEYSSVDAIFDEAVHLHESHAKFSRHDCNATQTGFADLIGYTGTMANLKRRKE